MKWIFVTYIGGMEEEHVLLHYYVLSCKYFITYFSIDTVYIVYSVLIIMQLWGYYSAWLNYVDFVFLFVYHISIVQTHYVLVS